MDPLAELVKLDPKSIGVGQYQHDVDQDALKRSLESGTCEKTRKALDKERSKKSTGGSK